MLVTVTGQLWVRPGCADGVELGLREQQRLADAPSRPLSMDWASNTAL